MPNEAQVKIRRRALGRMLKTKSGSLISLVGEIDGSKDKEYLTSAETKALTKQLETLTKIGDNFSSLSDRLEKS